MIKRLRNKFVLINMTIVTVMLVVIFSLILVFMGMNMEMAIRQQMQAIAGEPPRPAPHENGPGNKREDIRRPNLTVRIDAQGELLIDSYGLLEQLEEETLRSYIQTVLNRDESSGLLRGEQLRYQKRNQPFGQMIIFLDVSGDIETMQSLIGICVVIGVLSFFLFLVLSFALARWAVGPVETAWNQQRQFVADASHELKTPLTVIMTNAELLQSGQYPEKERSQFSESILVMSRQMRGLVESLLELARVDNGAAKMVFSQVDFSGLVGDCLLPFEPVYFEKQLQLESRIEEGLWVKGSASHLQQVVDILLDNGSKYSAPGRTVVVTLKRQGNRCLLSVANPGEPISREDLRNIFKRFYRIDKARAMTRSYGLGLAIADSVVKEHAGKIWAESDNGINTFFVLLPMA